jgi:PAS domain S-box-containing protein
MSPVKEIEIDDLLANPALAEASGVLSALAEVFLPGGLATELREPEAPTAETKYQALIEQIPAVVFLAYLDRGLGEAYVSPQIERLLGFTQQEWLGDPVRWYRQIHTADKARWSVDAAQLLLTGDPIKAVYRVYAKSGSVVWLQCEAKMVRKPNGEPWFIHGVGFDVTELKRAEETVRQSRDELERRVEERTVELKAANSDLARSNADLEQFAYAASHDLQEPLRTITNFTELLAKRYKNALDPKADGYIKFIIDSARQMQLLISELLTYSRVGMRPKPFTVVSTEEVVRNVVQRLHKAIADSGAAITVDSLPTVYGDEVQLTEVFQNLIGNALKFRRDESLRIRISARDKVDRWEFCVEDNGIGIDPKHSERIFVLFQRLHTHDEYEGTGIGLALCKKIVERHGGRIWVESRPGQGSTFFFTFSRRRQDER